MAGTSSPETVSTRLQRIAELARKAPDMVLTTLAHLIDLELLREAYRRTRKDGATGVDGQTAVEYAEKLEANLQALLDRLKLGTYHAPPVRRVHIPKGDGRSTRPIGIPTFEDKVLQRAVAMVLEAVYEQDFLDSSYGFRPGRSAHQALQALWEGLTLMGGGWVIEIDIQRFFDTLEHGHLRDFLDRRVRDGVLRRVIDKWLKAGVMEEGREERSETGTPQGGVISPLLANVYLHEVLDKWFETEVKPRLQGRAFLIRYADDAVVVCAKEEDARRVMGVLPKRFGKYALTLHPEKTRMLRFERPRPGSKDDSDQGAGRGGRSFNFLGFTHHWGKGRRGAWVVRRRTAKERFRRALRRVSEWCQKNRHQPLLEQGKQLGRKLEGHYGYYGITGNFGCLASFYERVRSLWHRWLSSRSQRGWMPWEHFDRMLKRCSLPRPKVTHSLYRLAAKP
jgi:RNA-directed DNA polymerase